MKTEKEFVKNKIRFMENSSIPLTKFIHPTYFDKAVLHIDIIDSGNHVSPILLLTSYVSPPGRNGCFKSFETFG